MTFSDMLFLPRTRSAVKRSARSEWCGDEARRQGRGPVVTGRLALRQLDVTCPQRLVRHLAQQMTDDVQAATSLAVGVRDMPRGPRGVRRENQKVCATRTAGGATTQTVETPS